MARAGSGILWRLALCALMAATAGCHVAWPWDGRVTDTVPGITPPRERIVALRLLVKEKSNAQPAEREQISARVAEMYPKETDPLVRLEIVRTLAAFPGQAADAIVRQAAKDSDADVRVAVCKALVKRRDALALDLLRDRLAADTDLDVRLAAAEGLGEIHDPASVAALGAALEDRDPAIQYRAVCSLRKAAPKDLGNDVDRWRQYVKDGTIAPPRPISLAERFNSVF